VAGSGIMRAMTAPSKRQAPKPTSAGFGLKTVRRADVRRLAKSGPPAGELPPKHAAKGDPRYPRPRRLRQVFAFTIDLVVHLGIGIPVAVAPISVQNPVITLLAVVGGFLGLSILDRIVVQRIFHATIGKMITGLCMIRDDTGGPPTVGSLIMAWLGGFFAILLSLPG
jgi:hypothetical protein